MTEELILRILFFIALAGSILYTIAVMVIFPNWFDYTPLGLVWLLSKKEREEQARLRALHRKADLAYWKLIRAAHRLGIYTKVQKAYSHKDESYIDGLENYLEPLCITDDGLLYCYLRDMPNEDPPSIFDTAEFKDAARLNVKHPVTLYEASRSEFTGRPGENFLIINLEGWSESGVPDLVTFEDGYAALQTAKARGSLGPLAWCVGKGKKWDENAIDWVFGDLGGAIPHLLIGGPTGTGKTVGELNLILTLCLENSVEALEMWLVDLKRNTFPLFFEHLPHLALPIATKVEPAMDMVSALVSERMRRSDLFERHKRRTIQEWNSRLPRGQERLKYIVCVFDEFQMMMIRNSRKDEFIDDVWDLASLGRELGIFIVLCTQYPKAEVIDTAIKANIEARIAHACDGNASNVILDNHDATRIEDEKGRIVFKSSSRRYRVQEPLPASSYKGWKRTSREEKNSRITEAVLAYVEKIRLKEGKTDPRTLAVLAAIKKHQEWISEKTDEYTIYDTNAHTLRDELVETNVFSGKNEAQSYIRSLDDDEILERSEKAIFIPPKGRKPRRVKFVALPENVVACRTEHARSPEHPPSGLQNPSGNNGGNGHNSEKTAANAAENFSNFTGGEKVLGNAAQVVESGAEVREIAAAMN